MKAAVSEIPTLGHLYHFATPLDCIMIGLASLLFLTSGAVQALLQLFMANVLEFDAGQSLTKVAESMVTILGGLLGGMQLSVFAIASLVTLYSRHKMMQRLVLLAVIIHEHACHEVVERVVRLAVRDH